MEFRHQFLVNAPLEKVVEFHRHASGLKRLTPPIAFMRLTDVPDPIQQGDLFTFSMWLGPIPIRWESQFPEFTEHGFVDIQGHGPFQSWQHRHTFEAVDKNTTKVIDGIEAYLSRNPLNWFVGLLMWLTLPSLFWYRQMQTRRALESA